MTTTYNSMPSRSTLELMLERIQELENEEHGNSSLPPLPARPVSRARLPSQARRALQQSLKLENKASSAFMTEAVVNSDQELIQTNGFDGTSTNEAEIGGVLIMQRCYRGYRARCYVNELKRSVITLQSLIRAEMSRKPYQHLTERLSPNHEMPRQSVQDVQSNLLRGQNGAIILLQSGIRGWLTRRHYKNIERVDVAPVEKSEDQTTSKPYAMDCIQIPYSIVFELQRRVLKTEAALQEWKQQNVDLRNNLMQYEETWLLYEEKMKSREKMWQEQLTSMQVSLADAAKKKVASKRSTKLSELLQDESPLNMIDSARPINHQNGELNDNDDGNYFQVKLGSCISKKDVIQEFQKLESQYAAWEKEYIMRLEETKATMKKLSLPRKEKHQKRWWRRPFMGGFKGFSRYAQDHLTIHTKTILEAD